MSQSVRFECDGPVLVITIDRPERRNAIDLETANELAHALDEFDGRGDLRAGVLTGAGGHFSAGMDLKALDATGRRPINDARGAFGIVEQPPVKPLIAAVEGRALGGGFEIALACDLVVAAADSELGLPEVKRGLVAAAGGVFRLPRKVPLPVAMEMVLTGEPITAGRAFELGLVARVVDPGTTRASAVELARAVAANAPLAVAAGKRIVAESVCWPAAEGFDRQRPIVDPIRESEDAREGIRAFVEKRAPNWTGQ